MSARQPGSLNVLSLFAGIGGLELGLERAGRGFRGVLADLHSLGFDAEWSVVSACSMGASHTRRRLFVVAYPHRDGEPVFSVDGEVAWLSEAARDRRHWGVPTSDDVRTDDGVSDRVDRLRTLGNAVVPAVTEHIGRLIIKDAARRLERAA